MLKIVLFLVFASGFLYAGLVFFAYLIQRRLIYFPTHRDTKGTGEGPFEPFLSASNEFLGYFKPASSPTRVLLVFHGNGGEALDRSWTAELAEGPTVAIVLAEYPGFGFKPGKPSQKANFELADRVIAEIQRRWPGAPITALGESLGSGVAAYAASKGAVERLALISPFSSAAAVGQKQYPFLPVKWLLTDRYDSVRYLKTARLPLHILHGTMDEVVPLDEGKRLLAEAGCEPKDMTVIPGYGHENIAGAATDSPFADKFRSFLKV